ncbi:protein moonraker [Elgaria multicarinata webbii]|uniref:protein moonraker n=1 Tax=Elgaria multicarinata webbii TaxID=159646 RepID=UPI002FCD26F9
MTGDLHPPSLLPAAAMEPREAAAAGVPSTSHPPRLDRSDKRAPQNQLQFSRTAPALAQNLPVRYSSPRPIVIEKLPQPESRRDRGAGDGLDARGSVEFSVVSEEELNRAVQLARRDVKRRHLKEQARQQQQLLRKEAGPAGCPRGHESRGQLAGPRGSRALLRAGRQMGLRSQMETPASRAKVFLYAPTRAASDPALSDSPPTRDPGPGPPAPVLRKEEQQQEDKSSREIWCLQKELQLYIQKIEELARKERSEKMLDPDEERRVRVRRQEQAVRSARMLYVLQQQVKEIQEDLEKLSPHKTKHTKKSRAMARLAAAHRGAIRALQAFVAHCADQPEQRPAPAQCKELGHLVRQLSLCSARLEMDSCVPDIVIDLLLQIEDLDALLARKASPRSGLEGLPASQADPLKGPTGLPRREKAACALEPRKPPVARRLLPDAHPEPEGILAPPKRSSPGGSAAAQARREALGRPGAGLERAPPRKSGLLVSTRPQGSSRPPRAKVAPPPVAKQARFQEPTVAFRLKETKPPVRESRTPWLPPSLASPLASSQRHPERSPRSRDPSLGGEAAGEGKLGTPKKDALRADGTYPTQSMEEEEAGRVVQERLEPLLAKAQRANLSVGSGSSSSAGPKEPLRDPPQRPPDAGKVSAALELGKKAEREPDPALSASDLETMLQRMEEIERSQEAVRRRYTRVVYSDPEFWAQEERRGSACATEDPTAPHPIQITETGRRKELQVDIVLGKPLDANAVEGDTEAADEPRRGAPHPSAWRVAPQKEVASAFLSVPKDVLQSIWDYGARFEQHLKRLSHEAVGNFDPWHVAENLAEQLAEEAVADVAAELQGLCEDYAEAVFTAEFLQAAE